MRRPKTKPAGEREPTLSDMVAKLHVAIDRLSTAVVTLQGRAQEQDAELARLRAGRGRAQDVA